MAAFGALLEHLELNERERTLELLRQRLGRDEERPPCGHLGVQEALRANRRRGIGLELLGSAPRFLRLLLAPVPEQRQPEVQLHERASRLTLLEPAQLLERAVRPESERRAHLRVERVGARLEHLPEAVERRAPLPVSIEARGALQADGLRPVGDQRVERQRRSPLTPSSRLPGLPVVGSPGPGHNRGNGRGHGRNRDDDDSRTRAGRHPASVALCTCDGGSLHVRQSLYS